MRRTGAVDKTETYGRQVPCNENACILGHPGLSLMDRGRSVRGTKLINGVTLTHGVFRLLENVVQVVNLLLRGDVLGRLRLGGVLIGAGHFCSELSSWMRRRRLVTTPSRRYGLFISGSWRGRLTPTTSWIVTSLAIQATRKAERIEPLRGWPTLRLHAISSSILVKIITKVRNGEGLDDERR